MTWVRDEVQEFLEALQKATKDEALVQGIQRVRELISTIHDIDHRLASEIAFSVDESGAMKRIREVLKEMKVK
ncbi:MAG: hypothetical protein ACETVR_04685 [Candidatus Bathyarchaeia archaeon]